MIPSKGSFHVQLHGMVVVRSSASAGGGSDGGATWDLDVLPLALLMWLAGLALALVVALLVAAWLRRRSSRDRSG